jgi:hypothetical protein
LAIKYHEATQRKMAFSEKSKTCFTRRKEESVQTHPHLYGTPYPLVRKILIGLYKVVAENDRFLPAIMAVEVPITSGQSGGKEVEFDVFCYQGKKHEDLRLDGEAVGREPVGDAARSFYG